MADQMPPVPDGWVAVRADALRRLQRAAQVDFLTDLYNRGAFERIAKKLLGTGSGQYALLLLDIDNFKQVNDSFGHPEGDRVLRLIADSIRHVFGVETAAGRVGGDEFIVLVEDADGGEAFSQRLTEFFAELRGGLRADYGGRVTVSAGAARFPWDAHSYAELFSDADLALYRAKQFGKDRFIFYNRGDMPAE